MRPKHTHTQTHQHTPGQRSVNQPVRQKGLKCNEVKLSAHTQSGMWEREVGEVGDGGARWVESIHSINTTHSFGANVLGFFWKSVPDASCEIFRPLPVHQPTRREGKGTAWLWWLVKSGCGFLPFKGGAGGAGGVAPGPLVARRAKSTEIKILASFKGVCLGPQA